MCHTITSVIKIIIINTLWPQGTKPHWRLSAENLTPYTLSSATKYAKLFIPRTIKVECYDLSTLPSHVQSECFKRRTALSMREAPFNFHENRDKKTEFTDRKPFLSKELLRRHKAEDRYHAVERTRGRCETKRHCATWQDKQLTLQEHFSLQRLCPLQYSQRSWSLFQSRPLPCMNSPLWSTANTCLLHRWTWSARGHAAQQIMINQVVWRHKRMAIGMTEERDISLFLVLHQCMAILYVEE